MEFLGIGPLELLFIIIIVIVVIGPKDIQRTMRGIGRGLNSLYKSEGWRTFNEVSRELRGLPNRLVREAELEELEKASKEISEAISSTTPNISAWTTPANDKKTDNANSGASATPAKPGATPAQPAAAPPAAQAQAQQASEAEPERTIAPPEALQQQQPPPQPEPNANGDAAKNS